jgi:methionyl-tRNA formyltransferase
MRVVFMGTPEFAVPSLVALVESGENVIAVVTQPDRPKGRKQTLTLPPVKEAAEKFKIPIYQPAKIKDPAFLETMKALSPDLMVVVAYGKILPQIFLDIPRLGCINIHGSILPKYRGAAPVHWAIIEGEKETGVTAMLLDAGMDTGPMLRKGTIPIQPDDTGVTLSHKMSELGARVLLETMQDIKTKGLQPIPQDSKEATYAPILKKEDGEVNWEESAGKIERKGRALTFWPGMFTYYHKALLKLIKIEIAEGLFKGYPGEILDVENGAILIAAGEGAVNVLEVQPENGRKMTVSQYLAGHTMKKGERLGEK